MTGLPPSLANVKVTEIWLAPAVTLEIVGAPGVVRGVLASTFEDEPDPTMFTALMAT